MILFIFLVGQIWFPVGQFVTLVDFELYVEISEAEVAGKPKKGKTRKYT